jgi:1-acyl-sn-glycerol-3-phosphate acyltransferase
LYYLLRILVWLGLKIYCSSIRVNRPDLFSARGPLILACNHPNAFLDAILLGSLFHQPVHFLARGDAFRKPVIRKLLNALQLIPVYRLTEGKEYLNLNEASFDKCQQILNAGGIVLIFAEGLCLNQWMLRPMKKGTARIAIAAMNEDGLSSDVRILPVSLNYNSFSSPGKTVLIHFGEMILKEDLSSARSEAEKMHYFNGLLAERLSAGMLQSNAHPQIIQSLISNHHQHGLPYLKEIQSRLVSENHTALFEKLKMPGAFAAGPASFLLNLLSIIILLIPAAIGLLLHAPFYFPVKKIIQEKTKGTVFYDSIMFAVLVITYPLYWILLNIIFQPLTGNKWISLFILSMPVFGWICVYWKKCFLQVRNYLLLTDREREMLFRQPLSNH